MTPLVAAAREIRDVLEKAGEQFCFIGGVALQRWGEPRFTRDVDLTLLCELGQEPRAVDLVLGAFVPRLPAMREFALQNRVILIQSKDGFPIDVALGALSFEQHCVRRATPFDFGSGVLLRTCSAEDLVVLKAFAGRLQDWADIEAVITRQGGALNWSLVVRELKPLLELRGAPERLDELMKIRGRIEKRH